MRGAITKDSHQILGGGCLAAPCDLQFRVFLLVTTLVVALRVPGSGLSGVGTGIAVMRISVVSRLQPLHVAINKPIWDMKWKRYND